MQRQTQHTAGTIPFAAAMPTLWKRVGIGFQLILFAALVACSDDSTRPPGGGDNGVSRVDITAASTAIMVGETAQLTASPRNAAGAVLEAAPIAWSSSDTMTAAVSASGRAATVQARRAGPVAIRATSGGKTGALQLTIRNPAPAAGALTPASARAGGIGFALTVIGNNFVDGTVVLWNGSVRATTYVSPTEVRAHIPAADVAQAGTAAVRVVNPAPGGGSSDELVFGITTAPVAHVQIEPATVELEVGATHQLRAVATDAAGGELSGLPVAWSSNNPNVAAVSAAGVITGVGAGTALITASIEGKSATASVSVPGIANPVPQLTALGPASSHARGEAFEITITGTGFLPNSAAFWNGGSRPSTYVSATELEMHLWPGDLAHNGTRQVRVINPGPGGGTSNALTFTIAGMTHVVFTQFEDVWIGETVQFRAVGRDNEGNTFPTEPVTWSSEHPGVATVDAAGRVTGVSAGHATITATMQGKRADMTIRVLAAPPFDLLFEGVSGGVRELWIVTPGPNPNPRRVLPPGLFAMDPAVTRDGSRIAFVGQDASGNQDIFIVNRDGTGLRQLTTDPAIDDQPAWSPDGQKIAFRSTRQNYSDVFVINADGTDERNLTSDLFNASERPSWSPDGQRILYSFGPAFINPTSHRIASVRPDGTDRQLVTSNAAVSDREPEVSPDGRHLAIRRSSAADPDQIRVINADGTDLAWLNEPGPGLVPTWSPDGQWLAFTSTDSAPAERRLLVGRPGDYLRKTIINGARNPVWIRR